MVCLRGAENKIKMDKAVEAKIGGLRTLATEVDTLVSAGLIQEQVCMMDVEKHVGLIQQVLAGIASLPNDPLSKHVDTRDKLVGCRASLEA